MMELIDREKELARLNKELAKAEKRGRDVLKSSSATPNLSKKRPPPSSAETRWASWPAAQDKQKKHPAVYRRAGVRGS